MILAELNYKLDYASLYGNSIPFNNYVRLWNIIMKRDSNISEVETACLIQE